MAMNLLRLRRKYSAALYAYFRVSNYMEAYAGFLADPTTAPQFKYEDDLTCDKVEKLVAEIKGEIADLRASQPISRRFMEQRLLQAEALKIFCEVREGDKQPTKRQIQTYINKQKELYGDVDPQLFANILGYLREKAGKRHLRALETLEEIDTDKLPKIKPLFRPKPETFKYYRRTYQESFPEFYAFLMEVAADEDLSSTNILKRFRQALKLVGADQDGWKVVSGRFGVNVMVAKQRKRIVIPKHFQPKSSLRMAQMIAHEVGCHVTVGHATPITLPEEGVALMLEQITAKRFSHKRTMRYFAVGLAIGIDGKPRDFVEVYRILDAAFSILAEDSKTVQSKAFSETTRVFRGGVPSLPGMCYLKDKVYLEQNLDVWQRLEQRPLDQETFVALLNSNQRLVL